MAANKRRPSTKKILKLTDRFKLNRSGSSRLNSACRGRSVLPSVTYRDTTVPRKARLAIELGSHRNGNQKLKS